MAKPVGTLGNVNIYGFGTSTFPVADPNTKILFGYGDTTNKYNSMRQLGSSSGYQVPIGKTFTVLALMMFADSSMSIDLGYADTDVGTASVTPPTNPIYENGNSGEITFFRSIADVQQFYPVNIVVPAQKYPIATVSSGSGNVRVLVIGVEI